MVSCPYITALDRPCGRPPVQGDHCAFHAVLHEFEINCGSPDELRHAIGALNR